MTADEFEEKFGEPKDWALAKAILAQVEEFRRSAEVVTTGVLKPIPAAAAGFFAGRDPEQLAKDRLDRATARVREPIIDLDKARQRARDLEEEGGWITFVPGLNDKEVI